MEKVKYLAWWMGGSIAVMLLSMILNANAGQGGTNLQVTSALVFVASLLSTLAAVIIAAVNKFNPHAF